MKAVKFLTKMIAQMSKHLGQISITLLGLIFLGACGDSERIKSSRSAQPYDYEKQSLHPDFKLFHLQESTSELYYSINTAELLYARVSPTEPFRANLQLKLHILHNNNIYDSLSLSITDTNDTKLAKMLHGKLELGIPDSLSGLIRVSLEDKLKGNRVVNDIRFDKRNRYDHHNFLLRRASNNEVIYNKMVNPTTRVSVKMRDTGSPAVVHKYAEIDKLPPPPFSYYNPDPIDRIEPEQRYSLDKEADGSGIILAEGGYYLIKSSEAAPSGIGIKVVPGDYPKLTKLNDLVESLRYITSRKEYEDILLSKDTKIKLDDFWIDCGGSMEKSRDLIRIYYGRVEEANRYFSCHLDGWKTDRGLVHIVYGNPTKVIIKDDAEIWIYGEENNINTLSFTFRAEKNELSDNYYVLSRDPIYKTSWSRAVDSWRNGRIYNE